MRFSLYEQQTQGNTGRVIEMTRTPCGVWVAPWERGRTAASARSMQANEPANQQASQLLWHSFRRWWQGMYHWLRSLLSGGPRFSQHTV